MVYALILCLSFTTGEPQCHPVVQVKTAAECAALATKMTADMDKAFEEETVDGTAVMCSRRADGKPA